jgi:hypothetical protein
VEKKNLWSVMMTLVRMESFTHAMNLWGVADLRIGLPQKANVLISYKQMSQECLAIVTGCSKKNVLFWVTKKIH